MNTKHIFSLAALAIMMAACSSDESTLSQSAPSGKTIPFSATVNFGNTGTRALTEDGGKITSTWEKDEVVALVHGTTVDVLNVTKVDETTGVATISGPITNAVDDEQVHVVYVGKTNNNMSEFSTKLKSLIQEAISAESYNEEEYLSRLHGYIINAANQVLNLGDQQGTLDGISYMCDFQTSGMGVVVKLAVSDGSATFKDDVTMTPFYSIWKLNLTTDGTTALKASKFVMKKEGEVYAAVDLGSETASVFYIAFLASPSTYSFEATAGDNTYTCTPAISGDLDTGKFYTSTLTMSESDSSNQYLVFNEEGEVAETPAIGDATAVASSEESVSWSGKYVVSSDVTINGDITLTGDVDLILMDGKTLTVKGAILGGGPTEENYENYSLNIYAQSTGEEAGKLVVNNAQNTTSTGVLHVNNLNIHGGIIDVSGTNVAQGIETGGTLKIYNGIVNAEGSMSGIIPLGSMSVYGGEITAKSTGQSAIFLASTGDLTITNGSVAGTNTGSAAGIETNSNIVITGGTVTAQGGNNSEGIITYGTCTIDEGIVNVYAGEGGNGLEGTIIINGGTVTAIGGDAHAESNGAGMAGIDGILKVTGGTVTATGGAKDGTGNDGLGISGGTVITCTGVTLYEGDSANPTSTAESQTTCSKRYAIIK